MKSWAYRAFYMRIRVRGRAAGTSQPSGGAGLRGCGKGCCQVSAPDFGGRHIHPTAGATAVGARGPLVAFNVNLDTPDVGIARKIAKTIRGSDGGFKYCKAIGVMLESRGLAQVSMNMVNHEEAPLYLAYDAIQTEAARYGVTVADSEIIGLAPAKALADCAARYMRISNYDYKRQVLESRLLEHMGSFE